MTQRFTYKRAPVRGTIHLDVGRYHAEISDGKGRSIAHLDFERATSAWFQRSSYRGSDVIQLDIYEGDRRFRVSISRFGFDPDKDEGAKQFLLGISALLDNLQSSAPRLRIQRGVGPGWGIVTYFTGVLMFLAGTGLGLAAFGFGVEGEELLLALICCPFLAAVGGLLMMAYAPGRSIPKIQPRALARELLADPSSYAPPIGTANSRTSP